MVKVHCGHSSIKNVIKWTSENWKNKTQISIRKCNCS